MVVTTYRPSGETCDMKPIRSLPPSLPRKVLHSMTFSLRIAAWGWIGKRAYRPLLFRGPSTSIPMVLPSRETEWQFVQEWRPVITTRLVVSATLRSRQAMSGMNFGSRGLMTPFSPSEGISGTSR